MSTAKTITKKAGAIAAAVALAASMTPAMALAEVGDTTSAQANVPLETTITGTWVGNLKVDANTITYDGTAHNVADFFKISTADGSASDLLGTSGEMKIVIDATSNNPQYSSTAVDSLKNAGDYSGYWLVGTGDNFYGQVRLSDICDGDLKINKAAMADATVDAIEDQTWTGEAIKPAVNVKFNGEDLTQASDYYNNGDYYLTYQNNVDPGRATILVKATKDSNFTGTKIVYFNIPDNFSITAPTSINYAIGKQVDAENWNLIGPSSVAITNQSHALPGYVSGISAQMREDLEGKVELTAGLQNSSTITLPYTGNDTPALHMNGAHGAEVNTYNWSGTIKTDAVNKLHDEGETVDISSITFTVTQTA